jgi:predicted phosphoribosyltransferase
MSRFGRSRRRSPYRDRAEAGDELAELVADRLTGDQRLVLALPRGGIPVAAPIARRLAAPLAALVVRKLGAPGRPELAVGAVATIADRVETVRNEDVISAIGLSDERFAEIRSREAATLPERVARFGAPPPVAGRQLVLVDDGLATGATMLAALAVVRAAGAAYRLVAVPVASRSALAAVAAQADRVVCPWTPDPFLAVGQAYLDFGQVPDEEAVRLLADG